MDLLCHSRRFCCGCPCPLLLLAFSLFCFLCFLGLRASFLLLLAGRCLLFSVARISVLDGALPCFFSGSFFFSIRFLRFFTAFSLDLFCTFPYPSSLGIILSTPSVLQIAIRAALALYLRAERSSNLCPKSRRTNSSELSPHQMACRCCSMMTSCFLSALGFTFVFFLSFAILVLLGQSLVSFAEFVLGLPSSVPGSSSSFFSSSWCTAPSCAPWLRVPSTCCWTSRSAPAITSKFFKGARGLLEGTAEFELPSSSVNKR